MAMRESVDAATATAFATLSRLRGRRCFHPTGTGYRATLAPGERGLPRAELFTGGSVPGLVRLSRAAGLPRPLPDPMGLALRVPHAYGRDRHQDFLLVSSGARPLARHLLVPARSVTSHPYSSLLPYRIGGELLLVGARADDARSGRRDRREPEDALGLSFTIAVASLGGPWRPVARLSLERGLEPETTEGLCFDPANTGGSIELAWELNRLRVPAYRGSQRGRGAREADADRPIPASRGPAKRTVPRT